MNVPSFEKHHGFLEKMTDDFRGGNVMYRWRFRFPNNYGASVLSGYGAYASKDYPFELAVVRWGESDFELVYSTPIANKILEMQTEEDVLETLDRIAAL